jgi:Na+/glutamate symporter
MHCFAGRRHSFSKQQVQRMSLLLPFWQRLLITIAAMLLASFLVGLVWTWLFGAELPSYVAGLVGGLAALPVWDFLRRIRPSDQ